MSHPNPLGQCRRWLSQKLPEAEFTLTNSTAEAARFVAASNSPHLVSIGTLRAAELYGLVVLESGIEDHPENETRFVLVGHGIPAKTGHDKTSILCFQGADHPGSLLEILEAFASHSLNLTKIESVPQSKGSGAIASLLTLVVTSRTTT